MYSPDFNTKMQELEVLKKELKTKSVPENYNITAKLSLA